MAQAAAGAIDTFTGVSGTAIAHRTWAPASPHSVVVVLHGLGEHSGRYTALAGDLNAAGYAVCALDHRGHGESGGQRVGFDRFDDLVDDVATLVADVRRRFPLPLFVLGHSFGGLVALRYVTRDHPDIAGLVLSGTAASVPKTVSPITVLAGKTLSLVAPSVGVLTLPLDKISKDPAVVAAYNADPLVTRRKVRARVGAEMLKVMAQVDDALPSLRVPTLIMHGGADVITTPDSSRLIHEHLGSTDKQLVIYDGLYHEIFNEPERGEVIASVIAWLNAHRPS